MTLFKKLLILVGSSMLALLLLASTNLYQMRQVYRTTNFANTRVVPGILLLDAALLEFGRIRTHLYRYALNTDSAEMGAQEAEIDKARKQLDATLKAYERLVVDPADKKMFDDERAALAQYNEGVDLIIGLSHGFRREEARTKLAEYDVQAEKLNASLAAHMRYNENVGKTAAADGGTAQSVAIWANAAVCSLGLVSMALLGWTIIRSLTQRLEQANSVVTRIAGGELGATRFESISNDELGMLLHSVDRMRKELAMTLSSIIKEADQVVIASSELSGVVRQVTHSAESQSNSAAAAAVAVEQLTTSIDQIDDNAGSASELASRTEKTALASGRSVEQASAQICQVADRVEHTARQMEALSQQVKEIGNITVVIREVADQTNLLALNAAIEAARAGEQGRGFAVVADEVRKLAERTTASVEEISQMIASIQSGAAMAVSSMQVSHEMVADVAQSASQASSSMAEICDSTQTVRQSIVGISEALSAQRETSQDLSRRVELIAEKSEENSAAVASVATTAQRLVSVSDGLKAAVSRFRF